MRSHEGSMNVLLHKVVSNLSEKTLSMLEDQSEWTEKSLLDASKSSVSSFCRDMTDLLDRPEEKDALPDIVKRHFSHSSHTHLSLPVGLTKLVVDAARSSLMEQEKPSAAFIAPHEEEQSFRDNDRPSSKNRRRKFESPIKNRSQIRNQPSDFTSLLKKMKGTIRELAGCGENPVKIQRIANNEAFHFVRLPGAISFVKKTYQRDWSFLSHERRNSQKSDYRIAMHIVSRCLLSEERGKLS